ncbi:hypothetical protein M758_4G234200 [Ceratodon purpureus]|nr:hypothetical protein M758_4G234200 [Ceratodon purpureus]
MASLPKVMSSHKSAAQADQVSCFDASMLYIRVTNCQPTPGIPESLIMHFLPRDKSVCLEVNGARIPSSEEVSLVLRCSRNLKNNTDPPADFMYVSTDSICTSSTLQFQILDQADSGNLIISGYLEKKMPDDSAITPKAQWIMGSNCEISSDGCAFVKRKHELSKHQGVDVSIPSVAGTAMEMGVVGRCMGKPMILTQTVSLKCRHNFSSYDILNDMPDDNEVGKPADGVAATMRMTSLDFFDKGGEVAFFDIPRSSHADSTSKALAKAAGFESKVMIVKFDSSSLSMTNTDQEKWYNRGISTGIKLGLGFGIGMCIGVGIGLGLIIHKFRTTTNSLKRITP